MVQFISKRLQVFVSSTYTDLREERQAAVEAILTAGHIPAGMELFTSGDESQMEVIKQWIDQSDVYLLILGGRYGSVEPNTQKSYTHLEYEYALQQGKPLFACVVNDAAQEQRLLKHGSKVTEKDNPQGLKEFRKLVLTKSVRFWDDSKDIKIAIGETLAQFALRDELLGWVRPTNEVNIPALAEEIVRLSKENSDLRSQLKAQGSNPTINGLAFEELLEFLNNLGVADILLENRLRLGRNFYPSHIHITESQMKELVILGLVEKSLKSGYQITEAGRVFLNRLSILQLSSQSVESVQIDPKLPEQNG